MEKVRVNATIGMEHYATHITAGHNNITADEPLDKGGKDKGFTPKELLASSLAACTAITLRMYISRKNWPLENIHVEVEVKQDTDIDSTIFERRITLDGEVTDEQRDKILTIANQCPVHKILTKSIFVNTSI